MPGSRAHIASIGISDDVSRISLDKLAISAATKALLDAGITYRDVDMSIAGSLNDQVRVPRSCFDIFGREGAPVVEMDNQSVMFTAASYIQSGAIDCALAVGIDRDSSNNARAVGIVLISDIFLTARAYLKDQAICIRGCSRAASGSPHAPRTIKTSIQSALRQAKLSANDLQLVEANQQSAEPHVRQALSYINGPHLSTQDSGVMGLFGLCGLVWRLRGWSHSQQEAGMRIQSCLQVTAAPDGSASILVLSRSDGRAAPAWSEIKTVRDGRERLGYNPAVEERAIAAEDLSAVCASQEEWSQAIVSRLKLRAKGGDRAALARL